MERIEPLVSAWEFPSPTLLPPHKDLITCGADLEPATLLEAYRSTYFPMPVDGDTIGWFSPDPRGIIVPSEFHVSRSLKKSERQFHTTSNQAFEDVLTECAHPRRPNGWIDDNIKRAYIELHRMGWAHSIEVWDDQGLQGGVYGIAIGSFFAGESMFHRRTDASKVALLHLVNQLRTRPEGLLDVQWLTPHLQSLGAREVRRLTYTDLLGNALGAPPIFSESNKRLTER